MSIGAELEITVVNALRDIGAAMILRKRDTAGFTPNTGVEVTEYDFDCTGVFTQIGLLNRSDAVQAGDLRVLVAGVEQDAKPEPGDFIVFRGEQFGVVKVEEIAPDGHSVCFDIIVRH